MEEKNTVIEIEDRYGDICFGDSSKFSPSERRPQGFVNIFEVDKNGNKELVGKSNLVLYQGREIVASRMFDLQNPNISASPNEFIGWFGLGSGGAPVGNPFIPNPPNSTDTDLTTPIMINPTDATCGDFNITLEGYTKHPFDSVNFQQDSNNSNKYLVIQVLTTMGLDDGVGQLMNEAGLFTAASSAPGYSGTFHLFAKVTFPTIYKSDTRELLFVWYLYV
jgi:hypothetical protein